MKNTALCLFFIALFLTESRQIVVPNRRPIATLPNSITRLDFSIALAAIDSRCTANGAIIVTTSSGIAPFNYRLDTITGAVTNRFPDTQNSNRFDALRPGTYRVTATDRDGFSTTATITVGGSYVLPTLSASVVGRTITLSVAGGLQPLRFTYFKNNNPSRDTSTQTVWRCLENGDYLFVLLDSCQNTFPYYLTVNVAALSFTPRCNAGTITAQSPTGGVLPYSFTLKNTVTGDSIINTTGIFPNVVGCGLELTMRDSCGKTLTKPISCAAALSFTPNCNGRTITAQSPMGGIPPYIFTLKNTTTGDSIVNTSGIFPNTEGCSFDLTMRDSCNKTLKQTVTCTTTPLSARFVCYNSQTGAATIRASGGVMPYIFRERATSISNAIGVFTGLPRTTARRYFTVTDACGQSKDLWIDIFDFQEPSFTLCPFTGDINLSSYQRFKDDSGCPGWCDGSFFPITYECLNCTPSVIVVDSGGVGRESSSAIMRSFPEGTFQIRATTACGETMTQSITLQRGSISLDARSVCTGISARATPSTGVKYILKSGTTVIDSNYTGGFNVPPGTYIVEAISPTCGTTSQTVVVQISATAYSICDSISVTICPTSNNYTVTLRRANGTIVATNGTGRFGGLPYGQSFTAEVVHANGTRLLTPLSTMTSEMPPLEAVHIGFCSFDVGFRYSTYYNLAVYPYSVVFQVYDSLTNVLVATSRTGAVFGLLPNHAYRVVAVQQPPVCGSQSIFIRTKAVDTPRYCITADYAFSGSNWVPVWDLSVLTASTNARLVNPMTNVTVQGSYSTFSQVWSFGDLLPAKYLLYRDSCTVDTLTLPEFPRDLSVSAYPSCPQFGRILAKGALTDSAALGTYLRSKGWNYCNANYLMDYRLYDSTGTRQIGSSSPNGDFTGLVPSRRYVVCSYLGLAQVACRYVTVPPYIRGSINAIPDALCPQDTEGSVTIVITNGAPPFIVEIVNLGRRIVTDSAVIVIQNVPRGNHRLRVEDGCLISADFNVSVGTLDPQLRFSERTCSGQITLSATNYLSATYVWRDSTGRIVGNAATISIQNDNSRPNTYTLDVTLARCTVSKSITISALPTAQNLVANAGRDTIVYSLTTILHGNSPTLPSIYGVWRPLPTNPNAAIFSDSTSTDPSVSVTQIGRFGFVWTLTDGVCATASDTVFITFLRCATQRTVIESGVCDAALVRIQRDTIRLSSGCDSIVETNYTLKPRYFISKTEYTCNVAQLGTRSDTVKTFLYRCDSIVETIRLLKKIDTTTLQKTICKGDSIQLSGIWYKTSGVFSQTLRNTEGCDSSVRLTLSVQTIDTTRRRETICADSAVLFNGILRNKTGIYTALIKDANRVCSTFTVLDLTVRLADTATAFQTICSGDTVLFFNKKLTISGIYTENSRNTEGCLRQRRLVLTVLPNPHNKVYTSPDTSISLGDSLRLFMPAIPFSPQSWRWASPLFLPCDTCPMPYYHFLRTKTLARVSLRDSNGCKAFAERTYRIHRDIYIPNAFSPNDDGKNDRFTIYGKPQLGRVVWLHIYGRWGNHLFFNNTNFELNDADAGWDGTFQGQPLPPDVFMYQALIRFANGEEALYTGDVTLMK